MEGIRASVKNVVRGLVGTRELDRRLHAIKSVSGRLAAAYGRWQADGTPALDDLLRQRDTAVSRAYTESVINTVKQASEDSFFRTIYNGVEVLLPRDTIRNISSCLHSSPKGPFVIEVESAHRNWMMSHITEGSTFLDVGSSTGTMTIPMAAAFGRSIQIIAFEPARNARRLLELALARNGLAGVEVVPKAVSNSVGMATFSEYRYDEAGSCEWLPEASAIQSRMIDDARVTKYDVEVTTLDAFSSGRTLLNGPLVIKIDVEGFEVHVLEGASALISTAKPWLSIDIHADPFGDGTTEQKVRAVLIPHGYEFEVMNHVLLASPPA